MNEKLVTKANIVCGNYCEAKLQINERKKFRQKEIRVNIERRGKDCKYQFFSCRLMSPAGIFVIF